MDRTKKGIAAAAGFCLFLALILFVLSATVFNIAGDSALMGAEMRRHTSPKVTGLPDKQYPEMGEMITDYLMGRKDSFQYYFTDADGNMIVCFQAHEANHMADCRDLVQMTGRLRWYMAGAALLLIIAGLVLRKQRKSLAAGILAGFGLATAAAVLLLAWGVISFDSLFTAFHRVFFTNDGWIMDSRTDMLVRLMPTSFFVSMGIRVLLAVTAVALVSFTAAMTIRMAGMDEEEAGEELQEAETAEA